MSTKTGPLGHWELMVRNASQSRLRAGLLTVLFALPMMATETATSRADTPRQFGFLSTAPAARAPHKRQRSVSQYFIEFRSRQALSYGHTFAAFGQLNGRGNISAYEVAGLHPAGDSPVPWMLGHVFLVPSETGASIGDHDERYITARYRVPLNESQYRKLTAYIKQLQTNSPTWHAVLYNCNAFVADIAKFMGLETPSSTLLYPADFINNLRTLNEGRPPTALSAG